MSARATVVIDGAWRQALTVARSLGRAGHRVLVVKRRGSRYLERSRHVDRVLHVEAQREQPAAWFTRLGEAVEGESGPLLLYPMGDKEIDFAVAHEEFLPEGMALVLANREALAQASDKLVMAEVAEGAGVPVIRARSATDQESVLAAAEEIGYPCLAKGNNEAVRLHHRKAFILRGSADVERHFTGWTAGEHPLLVQTYVDAPRFNVYFFAVRGEVISADAKRILRTDMADGTGLAVEGLGVPVEGALDRHTRALAAALGYDGAGCAQFLMDEASGEAVFLEINARLGANFAAVYRAGLDLPRMSVAHVLGEDAVALAGEVSAERRYGWFYGDVMGCVRALARGHVGPLSAAGWLGRALLALVRVEDHVTWDRRDPLPTLVIWAQRLTPWSAPPSL